MRDVIVIGCGIVGATVSRVLRDQGRDVLTLDRGESMSGTGASGGHLKPSWFGMDKKEWMPALELLDKTWGLITESFRVWPSGIAEDVHRVDTDIVLAEPKDTIDVIELDRLDNYPLVRWAGGEDRCRLLVVAAGVWAGSLISGLELTGKMGCSFRVKGSVDEPTIRPWAPYKQVVYHQQAEDEVWVGDGSAVLRRNWKYSTTQACRARCEDALGSKLGTSSRTILGVRPYHDSVPKGQPCLLRRIGKRTWVATGSGKRGTIAAGWVARRLLDA